MAGRKVIKEGRDGDGRCAIAFVDGHRSFYGDDLTNMKVSIKRAFSGRVISICLVQDLKIKEGCSSLLLKHCFLVTHLTQSAAMFFYLTHLEESKKRKALVDITSTNPRRRWIILDTCLRCVFLLLHNSAAKQNSQTFLITAVLSNQRRKLLLLSAFRAIIIIR